VLPKQVGNNPAFLTQFDVVDSEGQDFAPPQSAADEHGKNSEVPLARLPCSAVSQLPTRTPIRRTPFTR
jgi:hypothetical protein